MQILILKEAVARLAGWVQDWGCVRCRATKWPLPSSVLGNNAISFSDQVRDLGFLFDRDLTMHQHIIKTCQAAYIELKRISSIRHNLTLDATKTLVSSCILSRLDYCNSLLANCPQKTLKPLQQVQNAAAKLIYKARRTQHCAPILTELHWLPVAQRIKYKVSCLCFQVLTGTAPSYISQLLTVYVPSRSLRSSTDDRLFRVPRYSREAHGGRAFTSSALRYGIPCLRILDIVPLSQPLKEIWKRSFSNRHFSDVPPSQFPTYISHSHPPSVLVYLRMWLSSVCVLCECCM